MLLIIGDKTYELVEIQSPEYRIYSIDLHSIPTYFAEGLPDENFSHYHYTGMNVTAYKSIYMNGRFYVPKLITVDNKINNLQTAEQS